MNDEPTEALPTPTEPPSTTGSGGNRRWMIAAITGGVLVVVLLVALVLALRNNGNDDKTAVSAGGTTVAGNPSSVAASQSNGVVVINGGGGNAGTKPPPTDATTTTEAPTTTMSNDTTTTASGGGGGGATFHPPFSVPLNGVVQTVPLAPKLDYQSPARYGEANLSNGFSPDPYKVGVSDNGNVNVSYLGGSCSGFAPTAPDLRVNFGGGGASLLRLYFVASFGDASMVVNDPYGNFYCVNNSFGTTNPTIDFNNPAGGSYDIWVASSSSGALNSGTIFVTGTSGNHP